MSTVNNLGSIITNPATSQTTSSSSATSSQDMGESAFLTLLVTQLQNQDPLNPVSNQDFIAQLATFNSLEQLISINQAVTKLAGTSPITGSTG